MGELEVVPEDWDRALAIVAHPDDMEYGAASAVARWSAQGKRVAYLLVTRGEAGIASMPPDEAAPLRVEEQRASCRAVGVTEVEFLDHPDGLVEAGIPLRRDLAAAIRRHRPEVVLSINHRDSWGGPSWNHVDHRVVGRDLLDAVRDAANPWIFADAGAAWGGVRFVAFNASPVSSHAVDITDHLSDGVASLACHASYLAGLGETAADAEERLRSAAEAAGPRLGTRLATTFELVTP
jgi:LmbE family N-acetylglucosaminyl deacetylase